MARPSRRKQRDTMNTMIVMTPQTRITMAERRRNGLIPRNFKTHPVGYMCPHYSAVEMPLYPETELMDRIRQKEKDQSWISDILKIGNNGSPTGNLYQDGYGYCWAYSSGNGQQAARAIMGLPYIKLSPFAVAQIIKGGRDEGGWGAQSAEWAMKYGYPSDAMAPNLKKPVRDTPELRADMAKHRIDAMWYDLTAPVYSRQLSRLQVITCILNNCPVVSDFNWWSHSVLIVKLVLTKVGSSFRIDTVIQNNWDPQGQDCGNTVLQANRAWPDSAVAIRTVVPTAAPKKVVYPEPYYTPRPV